jgi:hypothetical protein
MDEAGREGMGYLRGTPMASAKNIQFQKAKVLLLIKFGTLIRIKAQRVKNSGNIMTNMLSSRAIGTFWRGGAQIVTSGCEDGRRSNAIWGTARLFLTTHDS